MGINGLGLILLSKFPILNHKITELSEFGNAFVEAELIIREERVLFYGAHFPRPGYRHGYQGRSMQFLKLAHQIRRKSMPSMIAGDFNATPFSPVFQKFLLVSGLKDTRKGFGWQPTWPVYFPGLWIPIDHILVSPEIRVIGRSTGSHIGSDHYPVIAELSMAH
jgi:endonuclease/exonuclease/phosphatase (EEP) superfamily protein YafD